MLNTRDLENRWLKYKIKSYIPHITITVSLIVIAAVISILLNSNVEERITEKLEVKVEKKITTNKVLVVKVEEELNSTQGVPVEKTDSQKTINIAQINPKQSIANDEEIPLKLAPSLGFMKTMQHSNLPYYQAEIKVQQKVKHEPEYKTEIVEEVQELDVKENIEVEVEAVEEKAKKISIKRKDTSDDIRHVIKRFKKNNNPALSLFIAKKYYELGEYHKAYNYALITNQIDRDIDASWIVFAKSLVKLEQKDMAIKTLNKYIENSHSSSAKILLEEIVSGKFR